MKVTAYPKEVLRPLQEFLAEIFDTAIYSLYLDKSEFYDAFAASQLAKRIQSGDITLIDEAAELGYEAIASQIIEGRQRRPGQIPLRYTSGNSPEYWAGLMLCYYQWATCLSFAEISNFLSLEYILRMYNTFRSQPPEDFANELNRLYRSAKSDTNLATLRKAARLTQSQLAAASDVPLRTLQQYEQRQKNINKAQAEYIFRLSRVLGCRMEDLIELV